MPDEKPTFDLDTVFQVDDYLYFYQEMLTPGRSETETAQVVKWLGLEAPARILDLACVFGRHANLPPPNPAEWL